MLNKAIQQASKLSHNKQRIASIIVDKKGKILAIGSNSYTKSHPKMALYSSKFNDFNKIYVHSEISCLIKLKKQGYAIYTARISKNNIPLPCRPCKICAYALKESGIEHVYFT